MAFVLRSCTYWSNEDEECERLVVREIIVKEREVKHIMNVDMSISISLCHYIIRSVFYYMLEGDKYECNVMFSV